MKISVVGLGKLGKPIYQVFKKHYKTIGCDKGDCLDKLGDVCFVVVPTPSEDDDSFNSYYVEQVLSAIKHKQLVVIVSTVMPGETDRLQHKYPQLTLVYSPTLVALGSVAYDFTHPDFQFIGSHNHKATEIIQNIYRKVIKTKPNFAVMTPLETEIAKLALNCYITTKITYANQIGNLCYRLGMKPDNILQTIGKDSRIGNKYFKSGLGYGGECFPRDNLALSHYFYKQGLQPKLAQTVHELNKEMIDEIIYRIDKLKPKSIGFKSLSFKKGSEIITYSQLKELYERLKEHYIVIIGKGEVNLDWRGIV